MDEIVKCVSVQVGFQLHHALYGGALDVKKKKSTTQVLITWHDKKKKLYTKYFLLFRASTENNGGKNQTRQNTLLSKYKNPNCFTCFQCFLGVFL